MNFQPMAPILNQIWDIAENSICTPFTLEMTAFDDGDFRILVFHDSKVTEGKNRESIEYNSKSGNVRYSSMTKDSITGSRKDHRSKQITTIEPPSLED